jgi:hypothetical protein
MNSRKLPSDVDLLLIAETAEERMSRVERIRQSVDRGSYDVPAADVAAAVVAFFQREPVVDVAGNTDIPADSC